MIDTENWVMLRGFPKYRVGCDESGTVRVWSMTYKRIIPFTEDKPGYFSVRIYDETGKPRRLTHGVVAFLFRHPDLRWHDVDFTGYTMTHDGEVVEKAGKTHAARYTVFRSIDDALETCILIKEFTEGNIAPVYDFIHEQKDRAICAAARRRAVKPENMELIFDEAVEMFLDKLTIFNVNYIKPLFSLLCQCLHTVWINKPHTVGRPRIADRQAARMELQY